MGQGSSLPCTIPERPAFFIVSCAISRGSRNSATFGYADTIISHPSSMDSGESRADVGKPLSI
eukprot:13881875-Ditylum_brightwellii.AAC.1